MAMGRAPDAMNCLAPLIAKVRKPHKEAAAHPRLSRAAPVQALGCTAWRARGTPSTGQECPVHVRNTLYTHKRPDGGNPIPIPGLDPVLVCSRSHPSPLHRDAPHAGPHPQTGNTALTCKSLPGLSFLGFLN